MPQYDENLLASAPKVTKAQLQDGYNADILLEKTSPSTPITTTAAVNPQAAGLDKIPVQRQEFDSFTQKKRPFYTTRKGIIIIAIAVIVVIIIAVVGGVEGSKKNNQTLNSGLNSTTVNSSASSGSASNTSSGSASVTFTNKAPTLTPVSVTPTNGQEGPGPGAPSATNIPASTQEGASTSPSSPQTPSVTNGPSGGQGFNPLTSTSPTSSNSSKS